MSNTDEEPIEGERSRCISTGASAEAMKPVAILCRKDEMKTIISLPENNPVTDGTVASKLVQAAAVALSGLTYYIYGPTAVTPIPLKTVTVPNMSTVQRTLSSSEVIQGCIRNDRRAQEALYQQYCGALLSVCLSYAKNEQSAVEVLQDGFLKIFQQIHTFDSSKSSLYTWMRTIMVRTAIDALRRGVKQPGEVELKEVYDPPIGAEAVERMSTEEIIFLLKRLPPTTRAVFQLYVQEGYNHREIGELLQISEGTSKWHLSEARKYLSNSLKTMARA